MSVEVDVTLFGVFDLGWPRQPDWMWHRWLVHSSYYRVNWKTGPFGGYVGIFSIRFSLSLIHGEVNIVKFPVDENISLAAQVVIQRYGTITRLLFQVMWGSHCSSF